MSRLLTHEPTTRPIGEGTPEGDDLGTRRRLEEPDDHVDANSLAHQRPADRTRWAKALDDHVRHFGRAPDLATANRGYNSAANEALATARGVRRVVLPKLGAKSPARRAHEQQR